MKLFIDIETIPSQKEGAFEEVLATIKHPGNITKQETIDKWYLENSKQAAEEQYRKQSFDGLLGEIISIAWAFNDEAPKALTREKGESESLLLEYFFEAIEGVKDARGQRRAITQWIGHYITGFDLRFLWQRCVVNSVRPTVNIPYDAKPWDERVFDTKIAWSGTSQYSGKSSLDALCNGFGMEGKGDLDGSKVYDYWLDGKYAEIAMYNKEDVIKCREIYKRLHFIQAA